MIVHEECITFVPLYDPLRYFHFGEIEDPETDHIHVWLGSQGACPIDPQYHNVYVDFEQPNSWYHEDSLQNSLLNENRYRNIFTVCPYTAAWRNSILGRTQYVTITYFLNTKYVPQKAEKTFDIIYTGNGQGPYGTFLEMMLPFDYRVVCGDPTVDYQSKLNLMSQSRITLVHNLIGIPSEARNRIPTIEGYKENHLFRDLESKEYLPQIKTRTFEAAFCRSLILCWKDDYNIIENFFERDREFIYLDADNSEVQILDILRNYGDYNPIIARAYEKAMNMYTTRNFLKYIQSIA